MAWFKELSNKLELFGLDTVFKVPNDTWTEEIYIAKDWGKAKSSLVNPWVQALKEGVVVGGTQKDICQYDIMNLYYSGIFILHSMTTTYRQELKGEIGERPNGPLILSLLLKNRMILVLSKQR